MGWIIEGLANVFIELLNDIVVFMTGLINGTMLDNSANQVVGSAALSENGFATSTYVYHSLLENTFPVIGSFRTLFAVIAWPTVALIALFHIIMAMMDTEGKNEHPASVLGHTAIAAAGVGLAYPVTSFFINSMSYVYKEFFALFDKSAGGIDTLSTKTQAYNLFGTDLIETYESGHGIGLVVIVAVFGFIMITYFIKLTLEFFERYVIIDVMFITAPLAFSTLASKNTSQIFRKWASMFLSNFIVMMMVLFFLGTFMGGLNHIKDGSHYKDVTGKDAPTTTIMDTTEVQSGTMKSDQAQGYQEAGDKLDEAKKAGDELVVPQYLFPNEKDFAYVMILLISLLVVGTRVDQYLKDIGFTVAQTGGGLGGAVIGAAMTMRTAAQSASKAASGVANAPGRIAKTASDYGSFKERVGSAFQKTFGSPNIINENGKLNPKEAMKEIARGNMDAINEIRNNQEHMTAIAGSGGFGINQTAFKEKYGAEPASELHSDGTLSTYSGDELISMHVVNGSELERENRDQNLMTPVTDGASIIENSASHEANMNALETNLRSSGYSNLSPIVSQNRTQVGFTGIDHAGNAVTVLSEGALTRRAQEDLSAMGIKTGSVTYDPALSKSASVYKDSDGKVKNIAMDQAVPVMSNQAFNEMFGAKFGQVPVKELEKMTETAEKIEFNGAKRFEDFKPIGSEQEGYKWIEATDHMSEGKVILSPRSIPEKELPEGFTNTGKQHDYKDFMHIYTSKPEMKDK